MDECDGDKIKTIKQFRMIAEDIEKGCGGFNYLIGVDLASPYYIKLIGNSKINLNEYIKVNLTAYGMDIFSSYYIKSFTQLAENEILKYIDSKFENGLLKIQMWEFCYIFGSYMLNGKEQLFHKNEIRIAE